MRQAAALDEMRRRLELQRARAEELVVRKRRSIEGVELRKEMLQAQIDDRVLPLSRALAAAHRQVQVVTRFDSLHAECRREIG